jgi:hypothetical protein
MTITFDSVGNRVNPPSPLERRSWSEDFEHENGNYFGTCATCGEEFLGHKRRTTCKLCAAEAPPCP